MSTLNVTNLAGPSSTGTAAVLSSINGGPISGARNRIINGDMRIDQRNAGAAQSLSPGVKYTVDRWLVNATGGTVTGQRVTGASANQYRYQITGAAGVSSIVFAQRIEAINSADLAGQTVTLSVDLSNSLLTTVTWQLQYANATDDFSGLTNIASGNWTVSGSINRYSAQISIPAAATTGLQVVVVVGAQTSGTWTIGNVQLEAGTVATSFERRSYGQELALCQRYYEVGEGWLGGYAQAATSGVYYGIPFKATKRAVPSLGYTPGATINVNVFDIRNATLNGANWYSQANTFGQIAWNGTWTASAEL